MKINILSPGRFHVLDLARELSKNGYDVEFYSFVPTRRAVKYGLPAKCNKSLFFYLAPFILLCRAFKGKRWTIQLRIWVQDRLTALVMRDCDVLISMSGDFVKAPMKAKRKGSIIIIERGSKHILEQKRILESIPSLVGTKPVPDANVQRELKCYEIADYISVATTHVVRSFDKYGYPLHKLFINPYGVDLKMFHPDPFARKDYDIICVGAWSYQKGVDLVIEAIKRTDYKLLHVGDLKDVQFPANDHRFTHIDKVDQTELIKYYNQAKVFVLASRQEGLAMVQAQAIACNVPVIGSHDSGAEDLQRMVANPEYISMIDAYDVDSVIRAIDSAMCLYNKMGKIIYAGDAILNLTWEAYGKRYAEFLNSL